MDIAQKLQSWSEEHERQMKALGSTIGVDLLAWMKVHPQIKAIGWKQYTPYFNDGDVCEFGFYGLYVSYDDERDDEIDGAGWTDSYEIENPADKDDIKALSNALNDAPEILKAAFGDHASVVVTQTEVTTSEYEHD